MKAIIRSNEIRETNLQIQSEKSQETIFKTIFKAKNDELKKQREFGGHTGSGGGDKLTEQMHVHKRPYRFDRSNYHNDDKVISPTQGFGG